MNDLIRWSKLINFFISVTDGSHRKMYLLATDHLHKLQEMAVHDPFLQDLLTFLLPFYNSFIAQYRKSNQDRILLAEKTADLSDMLVELSTNKIRQWDIQIQGVYDMRSNVYKRLLPDGRGPFQTNSYEMRIEAILSLAERLNLDPQLSALGQDVEAYGLQLQSLRMQQQGIKVYRSANSKALEEQRLELAKGLYAVFCRLKGHYYEELYEVEKFYKLHYFRTSNDNNGLSDQEVNSFEISLEANSRSGQLEDLLEGGQNIRLTHLEGGQLQYYTVVNAVDTPLEEHNLDPLQSVILTVADGHQLLVVNNTHGIPAKLQVEIL